MRQLKLVLALVLLTVGGAQAITVQEIVQRSRRTLEGVNDFVCTMIFNVRSPDMRVPDSRVRIYFKQPDKLKPEAIDKDFAVLPKTYHMAIGNVLAKLVETTTPYLVKTDTLYGHPQYVLKLVPKESDEHILYHWVYVDQDYYTVSRIISQPRNEQPVTLSLGYEKHGEAWLPNLTLIDGYQKRKTKDGVEDQPIQVKLRFEGYKVNVGLKDSVFSG